MARGSQPPRDAGEWLRAAIRARFPKLAAALGERAFDGVMAAYLDGGAAPEQRLAEFIACAPDYPAWWAELAALEHARVDVARARAVTPLTRLELTSYRRLRLAPTTAQVHLMTAADELYRAIDRGNVPAPPRELDYPRLVLVWRNPGDEVRMRTVEPDEATALRAVARGATLNQLAILWAFRITNPHARALDLVVRWLDAGLLAR